jgi:hypothetical protein
MDLPDFAKMAAHEIEAAFREERERCEVIERDLFKA